METWWLLLVAASLAVLAVGVVLVLRRRRASDAGTPPASKPSVGPRERLRHGLLATRRQLEAILSGTVGAAETVFPSLEEALVSADVGVRTSSELVERVRRKLSGPANPSEVRRLLREEIEALLAASPPGESIDRPHVVLVTGVNGVGKTTTIGKLAASYVAAGKRVLLVAGDTFRAAAADQLRVWAERTGSELVAQEQGANPSAVVFDGIKAARARDVDVVLVDTAGRLHTSSNLMEELRKLRRLIARELPGAPHETLLVLDATTGQNAVAQARTFAEALEVTGLVLTKLDGTARGGVAIAVVSETKLPLRYIGIGEGVEDLRPFDASQFAAALLDPGEEESSDPARNP
jgi:fused signal recognition particle receptor